MADANADVIEAWNTVLFHKFTRYQHLLIQGLGQHGSKLFECYRPPPGARVVDIGCGMGDTTVRLAELVGSDGEVVGIDCAENFISTSQDRAAEYGAGEAIRLASDKAADLKDEIEKALLEAFEPYKRDDGVWATSSTWLITARAAG